MYKSTMKNLNASRRCTINVANEETAQKIIQLVHESGLTTNKVMNMLIDYAVAHAKIGRIPVYHTAIVFGNDAE